MIADAGAVPAGAHLQADLCIVGAGAAGIAIARELAGRDVRVALLESGGLSFEPATQALYRGRSVGLPYFPLDAARLRYFGGTTGHWAGTCRPFEAFDFEPRPGVPDTGWPIGLGDVEPYYGRAAEVVGLTPGPWGLAPWAARDRVKPLDLGERLVTRVARFAGDDARHFGSRYRAELERAANVSVHLHANVTELETGPDGGAVVRAHVATLGGRRFTVGARVFVLACGALENARVLLLSDRHRRGGLGNQHDAVGRWFHEHPRFVGAELVPAHPELETRFYEPHRTGDQTIEAYLALADRVQREERLLDVQLKLRPVYRGAYAGIEDAADVRSARALGGSRKDASTAGFARDVANVMGDLTGWHRFTVPGAPLPVPYPEVASRLASGSALQRRDLIPGLLGDIAGYTYAKLLGTAPVDHVEVTTRLGQAPNRDSRVTLGRERDALGLRRIDLDWRMTRLDRESIVRTLELVGAAVGAAGLGRLRLLVDRDGPWPASLTGGWHMMGTTRMSDDPRRGVVDRDCRVHGVGNLFVAGSSVFPTPGAGTPTLTLVALALRLSDRLRRELA